MSDSPELAAIRDFLRNWSDETMNHVERYKVLSLHCISALRHCRALLKLLDEERSGSTLLAERLAQAAIERDKALDALRFTGHVPCDIPACNCGSWHHRYGLPQRWSEIKEALETADVLDNSTGNKPLTAIQKLMAQRDEARAENEWLREAMERGSDG